jgi:hypothetical protein
MHIIAGASPSFAGDISTWTLIGEIEEWVGHHTEQ